VTAITYQELRNYGACDDALEWWLEIYDYDAVVDLELALADCPEDDWVVWLASKRHPAIGFVWAGMAMRWAGIVAYADNVTEENWREARSAARNTSAYNATANAVARHSYAYDAASANAADRRSYADATSAWSEMRTVAEAWLRAGGRPG